LLQDCYRPESRSAERQQLARRYYGHRRAMFGQETMADNFRLLLQSVARERLAGFQHVAVAAEWMAHQRQIEAAALLRLPNVGQLVDEETLAAKRLGRRIIRPP